MVQKLPSFSAYFRLMRLHAPVGIWLLLWPCWWAIALAGQGFPWLLYGLFAAGAVVMRSAGCIINDMADRDFDRQVERTKTRPLASGELSMRQASVLLGLLLATALAIAIMLGPVVVSWAAASLAFVIIYPFMKRLTWWPQLFLGLTFNWGALIGYAAVTGGMHPAAVALYLGGIFWTLGYDTIYAHQDKLDDARIGVKSTALKLGGATRKVVGLFYSLALVGWFAALLLAGGELLLPGALLALAGAHFCWQLKVVDLDKPDSCRDVFRSNTWLGAIVWLAYLLA